MFSHHQHLLRLQAIGQPHQLNDDGSSDESEQSFGVEDNYTSSLSSLKDESSDAERPGEVDVAADLDDTTEDAANRSPTPWKTSRAKQRIIDELSEPTSDIFLLIGKYTADAFDNVNFAKIRENTPATNTPTTTSERT